MNTFRNLMLSAVATGIALTAFETSAVAGDRMVMSGNDKQKIEVYGLVNRAIAIVDDGDQTDVHHVDNDAANTRFGIMATAKGSNGVTIGANIELSAVSNASSSATQTSENSSAAFSIDEKKLEVFVGHDKYGKLWLGQGATATEDVAETDLTNLWNTNYSYPDNFAGMLFLVEGQTDAALNSAARGPAISAVLDNFDGLGRTDRIRYDTPEFGGLQLRVGATQGGNFDAGAFYSANYQALGGLEVAASLGYTNQSSTSTTVSSTVSGSVSILHSSGISLTASAGEREGKGTNVDASNIYAKIGYKTTDLTSLGTTNFGIDYQLTEDMASDSDEAEKIGFGVVQELDAYATEVYAAYHHYELERTGTNYEDLDGIMFGAMVSF